MLKRELAVLERCHQILETEKPLREAGFTREETNILKTYQLLSIKPMLIALNFDETQ
jgi:ribosome-binding ATPase YchF (GTP1/OBG family)